MGNRHTKDKVKVDTKELNDLVNYVFMGSSMHAKNTSLKLIHFAQKRKKKGTLSHDDIIAILIYLKPFSHEEYEHFTTQQLVSMIHEVIYSPESIRKISDRPTVNPLIDEYV